MVHNGMKFKLHFTQRRKEDIEWNHEDGERHGLFACIHFKRLAIEKTPWPKSVSELYRPSDRRLSEK
jgi:hypothetical protein